MKLLRHIGSMVFVLGLFTALFAGIPWYVIVADNPIIPWWLRMAIFCLLGGLLLVLMTLALEQRARKTSVEESLPAEVDYKILLLNSDVIPGREISEILGLVQGHTVFAVWLGKDLSAIVRLILGGELTEYTEMMGIARSSATKRMAAKAVENNEVLKSTKVLNFVMLNTACLFSSNTDEPMRKCLTRKTA